MGYRPISHVNSIRRNRVSTQVSSWFNFSPLSLQPAIWLDASDAATITSSSGAVSQWNDKSGNGRHVSQATSTAQPTTGTNTQNGLNVITFDGGDWLKTASDTTNAVATVFGVGNHTSTALGGRFFCGRTGLTFQTTLYPYVTVQSAGLYAGLDRFGPTNSVAANKYYFATWRLNGASSQVFVNGVGGTVGNAGGASASLGTVGARGDNAFPFIGHIAEVIVVFSVVDENTRIVVENYLRSKWAVQP